MSDLKLFTLGSSRLERAGTVVEVETRKSLALLVYLAVTRQVHNRDSLATLFWPENDQTQGRTYLRRALWLLKNAIGENVLLVERNSVGVNLEDKIWLDLHQFHELLDSCKGHGHTADEVCKDCLAPLSEAVDLYKGLFLAGFSLSDSPEFDDWQFFQADGLQQELAWALERLVQGYSAIEDYESAIPHARRWVSLDPLRELAQRALMSSYHQAGQVSAALRQYEQLVKLLNEEMGLPPEQETAALYETILSTRVPEKTPTVQIQRGASSARHHLPAQATAFVPRELELADIQRNLNDPNCRLLTLVGPGGSGKTRLALAAAEALKDSFPNGVHFVPLAPIKSAEHILSALVKSLDIGFYDQSELKRQFLDYMAPKQALLILDNFEHLLAGSDLLVEILQTAPGVKIVATSREQLNLSGETAYVVGGMAYPDSNEAQSAVEVSRGYSAVRLFVQQAKLSQPGFELKRGEIPDVVHICRMVQGMPLALVLAAGWLNVLSLADIRAEISRDLDFLETEARDVPDRQRSMRVVFDSSWQHLSAEERAIFMRLSIFRGGFTRHAAEAVAGANLRSLRKLVHKSFIIYTQNDRYEIHELLRQYGAEELTKTGQGDAAHHAHSRYFLELLRELEADLRGRAQAEALQRIAADLENVRAAWGWGLAQKDETAVCEAVESLHLFFDFRGQYADGIDFLRQGYLALKPVGAQLPGLAWEKILARLSFMRTITHMTGQDLESDIAASLAIAREHQDQGEVALCQLISGYYAAFIQQDPVHCLPLVEGSLEMFYALEDPFYAARALNIIAMCQYMLSGTTAYEQYGRQSLDLFRQIGSKADISLVLYNLAEVAFIGGRYSEAIAYCQEALALGLELNTRQTIVCSKNLLGLGHLLNSKFEQAEIELSDALEMSEDTRMPSLLAQITAVFSILYALRGDNTTSELYGNESLRLPAAETFTPILANWGLAANRCNQGQFAEAHSYLQTALEQARRINSAAIQTWLLPAAALVAMHTNKKEQALEMLALASHHPLSPTGWQSQWPPVEALRLELEMELGSAAFNKIWAKGGELDLDAIVTSWLATGATPA